MTLKTPIAFAEIVPRVDKNRYHTEPLFARFDQEPQFCLEWRHGLVIICVRLLFRSLQCF
jgi:hypothetical protein